ELARCVRLKRCREEREEFGNPGEHLAAGKRMRPREGVVEEVALGELRGAPRRSEIRVQALRASRLDAFEGVKYTVAPQRNREGLATRPVRFGLSKHAVAGSQVHEVELVFN